MMKRFFQCAGLLTAAGLLGATGVLPVHAAMVTVDPVAQTVDLGDSVTMSIRVDGIDEDSQLGSFQLEILYDGSFFSYGSADFGAVDPFNIPVPPNENVQSIAGGLLVSKDFGGAPGVSTAPPFSPQDASFILVALTFDTLQVGTRAIALGLPQLYTVDGELVELEFVAADGMEVEVLAVTPEPVPEPSTLALLALGLAGFGFALRRRSVAGVAQRLASPRQRAA